MGILVHVCHEPPAEGKVNFAPYLIVFLGAGIGGALRHGVNELMSYFLGNKFPFGILTINMTGSFLLGLLAGYWAFKGGASQHWRLFLTVGICGGYTTFSAFSQDAVLLLERSQYSASALYVLLSVGLSLGATLFGLWIMRHLG
jgi:CrcB protein